MREIFQDKMNQYGRWRGEGRRKNVGLKYTKWLERKQMSARRQIRVKKDPKTAPEASDKIQQHGYRS